MKFTALIEIEDAEAMTFKNPVRILRDFDVTKPIGKATVYKKDDGLYADMEINENIVNNDVKGLFPAVGFMKRSDHDLRLLSIGLCKGRNEDMRIKPLD